MAESVIFVLIVGALLSIAVVAFGIHQWVHPIWIVLILFALLVPGLWGAFTTGPYVPSSRKRHRTMLKLAKLNPSDVVYELGCGDGWLTFQAAKHARRAIGYEISIPLLCFTKLEKLFLRSRAHIRFGDIWKQNYSDADVIFCYLMPHSMKRLYKEIWPTLRPGTRVITNAFRIHDLQPVQSEESVYVYQKVG